MRILLAATIAVLACAGPVLAKGGGQGAPPQPEATGQATPPAKPVPQGQPRAASSCAAPLRQGCESQQASCRISCPPMWSTNPAAPAFTPTDRAGCTQQCLMRYLSCLRLYGCS